MSIGSQRWGQEERYFLSIAGCHKITTNVGAL